MKAYLGRLKSLRENNHHEIESRRDGPACPGLPWELVERGRLNFRPVQIRIFS
jgi:hypothetical protein